MQIIIPKIFPKNEIIAGVTERNLEQFPPFGFSISNNNLFDEIKLNYMKSYLLNYIIEKYKNNKLELITQKKIHSDSINIVEAFNNNLVGDSLITTIKNKILTVSIADCAAVLIYDIKNKIIAAIHSGWRGSKLKIVSKTIQKLIELYNSRIENLLVYISPLASVKNYEVGEEFLDIFPDFCIKNGSKYYFDNKSAILSELKNFNIKNKQIEASELCTIENTFLHSFRRDGINSGRMAAFICIIGESN
jgi:YfiH family protein